MIGTLAVAGYRSLRDCRVGLGPLTVVTGANGSGKSSLYRALRLLADVAQGRVIGALAGEGGLASTLWAGPESMASSVIRGDHPVQGTRRTGPVALKLGFAGEDYGYAIDLGLPTPDRSPDPTAFGRDPEIKAEALWLGAKLTPRASLALRTGATVRMRDGAGAWRQADAALAPFDSMMTHAADPRDGFELLSLRERMRDWRFYDQFRTDRDAPVRRPQVGTRTPILAHDGADLAAALQTIHEIGDRAALTEAVADAFAGAILSVAVTGGLFAVEMRQPGLLRPLDTAELSDGTLRYLHLVAALLTPRPPSLMVLNEPEASLHPDLLPPLARLIGRAVERSQIVVVTHAGLLLEALEAQPACRRIRLSKRLAETILDGGQPPGWVWPTR